jgi:GT2 family glycosyltransferase
VIAAIMPVRGRLDQTVRNVQRLLATAGRVEWSLTCIGGEDETDVLKACSAAGAKVRHILHRPRLTYWEAMQEETQLSDAPLICGLANDLLPGRDWLARALAEYRCCFGSGDGLMGLNDGIHTDYLSPHFLISRTLLDRFGGWPVWYKHTHGDAELCERAKQAECYGKAPWAVLYHDHPITGGATDSVYDEGRAHIDQDAQLFEQRRRAGWPTIR